METRTAAPPRAGRREWIGLAVLALPTLLLALDLSVLYLALPHISDDLGADSVQQLWITDIYGFMVAGFLVTMGTLGDRVGRRRLLMTGAAAFGVASLLAAYAPTAETLIAARALLGVAGATLAPSTLALIRNMFADERQRTTAVAVWVSCFMGGAAIGPVVGGLLLEAFWWGSVFLLAVPVMVLLLAVGPWLLPEYRDDSAGRLDLPSTLLFLATALPVVYGLKELTRNGPGVVAILAIVAGLAFGAAFVRRQGGLDTPLLDLRLFRRRAFTAALVVLMFAVATQGGIMLVVTQQMQIVEGLSPVATGLWLMPGSLAMVAGSLLAPHAARLLRPGPTVAAGMAVTAIGYLLLTRAVPGGLPVLVAGAVVVFFGIGPVASLTQNLIVSSAPPAKAGSAASVSQTGGDFGIALGVAVFGSIAALVYRHALADTYRGPAGPAADSIAGAAPAARDLPAERSDELLSAAHAAFTSGLHVVAAFAALLCLALAVLAAYALRQAPEEAPEAAASEAAPDTAQEAGQDGPPERTIEDARPAGRVPSSD
ncbi:MFS transporter [Microbispora cellulosiformans]|uniref:MFS transporter n=1 Tax=Microbispora cellulosiformans TaxID=2614688 RepID=A0A5J5K0B7_9ACTN|nr:MFS transporter [Microbispora cellulosiformans]KAA9377592.1 MFS transporter [Microbispora cellulosiformans]